MPVAFYSARCAHTGSDVLTAEPRCLTCGLAHEFVGWRLSMHESMARYQYVYGLKPVGPHREMADTLLEAMRHDCPGCKGVGLLVVDGPRGWRVCRECEGTGGFWSEPAREVKLARGFVTRRFPGSEARRAPTNFITGALVQDLQTGEIVDLEAGAGGTADEG